MVQLTPQAIKAGLQISGKWLVKAAPTLGVIVGTGLMAGATIKTGIETPKMKEKLDELKEDESLSHGDYFKKKTMIFAYHLGWPAVMMLLGMLMIFGGYKIKYTQAAIATAALASKTEEAEKLEKKFIEKYGDKEYEKMKDEIAQDEVKAYPVDYSTVIHTGHGNTLCFDPIIHDYYWSDLDYIRKTVWSLNDDIVKMHKNFKKSTKSYNTFRECLDLPASNESPNLDHELSCVNIGKDIGWYNSLIELKITVMLLPDDTPCHIIGFTRSGAPKWHLNVDDSDGEDADRLDYDLDDDETDMKWRGI